MTDPVKANIIASDPRKQTSGGRHQIGTLAGFKSESWPASVLELLAGFVGIRKLQAKIGRARNQLLTFCDFPGEVDVTNNGSERKLRPCVIQRKVTNGYRAM